MYSPINKIVSLEIKKKATTRFIQLLDQNSPEADKLADFGKYLSLVEGQVKLGNAILAGIRRESVDETQADATSASLRRQPITDMRQMIGISVNDLKGIQRCGDGTALLLKELFDYISTHLNESVSTVRVDQVDQRVKAALQILRKNKVKDTSGAALAEILRQLHI